MKHHPLAAHNELKGATMKRSLTKIRTSLPPHLRIASIFIHWPPVEVLGSLLERILKPSFLIGGGIASLSTSILLFNTAQTHGYEFNYSAALVALLIGGLIGSSIGLLVRITRSF